MCLFSKSNSGAWVVGSYLAAQTIYAFRTLWFDYLGRSTVKLAENLHAHYFRYVLEDCYCEIAGYGLWMYDLRKARRPLSTKKSNFSKIAFKRHYFDEIRIRTILALCFYSTSSPAGTRLTVYRRPKVRMKWLVEQRFFSCSRSDSSGRDSSFLEE